MNFFEDPSYIPKDKYCDLGRLEIVFLINMIRCNPEVKHTFCRTRNLLRLKYFYLAQSQRVFPLPP